MVLAIGMRTLTLAMINNDAQMRIWLGDKFHFFKGKDS